jgi:hypothetical protein
MNIGSAWVRQLLDKVLRTDADLVAFCIDRIPDAAKRFSGGMDRVEKTNLILRLEEPETVLRHLHSQHPEATDRAEAQLRAKEAAKESQITTPGYRAESQRRRWSETEGLRPPILTIDLSRPESGVAYYVHFEDDLTARPERIPITLPPAPPVLGPQYVFDKMHGIEAIHAVLDRGQEHILEEYLAGKAALDAGAALFEVLFPSDAHWQAVIRRVRGLRPDSLELVLPTQEWVRLRICTAIPHLQALPWRLLSWEGHFLVDHNWTMEVVPTIQVQTRVKLTVPCKLLIVAPQYRGMTNIGTERHVASLKRALSDRFSGFDSPLLWRVVHNRKQLASALLGMQPDILYYFGHGSLQAGGLPSLELGDSEEDVDYLLLSDLLRMIKTKPPLVAWMNGCMTGAKGFFGAGHQLVQDVPIVISQRTTAFSGHAAYVAQQFFQRFLLDGKDPAKALHHLDDLYSRTDFQWSTAMLHTSYASCEVQIPQLPGPSKDAAKRLDRREPKALVDDFVSSLKKSPSCRVHALLVGGTKEAEVDHFSWQCTDHLIHKKDRRLLRFDLGESIPVGSRSFSSHLDALLRRALDSDEGEAIEHALRKRLRQQMDAVWIDFGVLRPAPGQAIPILKWLSYCCDVLGGHCPPNCRVIAVLGVELPEDELSALRQCVSDYQDELREHGAHQAFRCDYLEPHPMVTEADLHHFFDEVSNTSCPVRLRKKAAKLIFRCSAGVYADSVRLIEKGEREKWDEHYFYELEPTHGKGLSDTKKRRFE